MTAPPSQPHEADLRVDLIADGEGLWVTAEGRGLAGGVGACWRHRVDVAAALHRAARLRAVVERANADGEIDRDALRELERLGALLFDDLFPAELKARLRALEGGFLTVGVTAGLVGLPVELLHDGEGFLALRWALGRQLLLEGWGEPARPRPASPRARVLVVADPDGSLPECYNEGVILRQLLERCDGADVALHSTRVGRELVREELRDFDLVHVAGHVESDGLRLADGRFTGDDVAGLAGGRAMPRLVVLNGCAAGDGAGMQAGGLARRLLEAGVTHVVGPLYEVPDPLARDVAIAFWGELARGEAVGEALRRARLALADERGETSALWATYALFGSPKGRFPLGARASASGPGPDAPVLADREPRAPEALELAFAAPPPVQPARLRAPAASALAEAALHQPRWLVQTLTLTTLGLLVALIALLVPELLDESGPGAPRGRVVSEPAEIAAISERPLPMALLTETAPSSAADRLRLWIDLEEPAFVDLFRVSHGRLERLWPEGADEGWLPDGRHLLPADGAWLAGMDGADESLLVVRRTAPRDDPDGLVAYLNDLLATLPMEASGTDDVAEVVAHVLAREGGAVDQLTYAAWPADENAP